MGGVDDVPHVPEAWCALDGRGVVCRANCAATGRLGSTLKGRSASEVFGPQGTASMRRIREGGPAEVVEDLRGLRWFLTRHGDEIHCLGLPARLGVVGRGLARLAQGLPLADALREITRDVAATWLGTRCLIELWDDEGPMLVTAAPGQAPPGTALLEAAPQLGIRELGPDTPLVRAFGKPVGLDCATISVFEARGPKLKGALAIFGALPQAVPADDTKALTDLVAATVRSWDVERECRDVAERYRLITEATQHAIYDWDITSDQLQLTSRASDVFGHHLSPHMERVDWWKNNLHPEDAQRVSESLQRAMAHADRFWTSEYRFHCADGHYAWVFDRGAIVYDASRRAVRMVGVMEDISKDRQMQSQLHIASRLAAVGTLASGVAHEINNPLAWVTTNLGFAVEELQKLHHEHKDARERVEETMDALDDAAAGARRIAQIVSDLRTFASPDSEGLHPISVNRAVESALTVAYNELRHRGRIVRSLQETPTVQGSEGRLSQAVLNLLLNAAWSLASSPSSVNEVRVVTGTRADGAAFIEVSDTGPGIEPEVLPRIFDPFFTTKPAGEGLGLGLSVTHSIIVGFGGTIEVNSERGHGTIFRIVLPALVEAVAPAAPRPAIAQAPSTQRSRIAVVDDEQAILTAFQRLLGPSYEVRCFKSGSEALAALRAETCDLVFCDVMMPGLTGPELLSRIGEEMPELADRFVFMTGGAFTAETAEFMAQTKVPVLDKPFTPQALRELVAQHLKASHLRPK